MSLRFTPRLMWAVSAATFLSALVQRGGVTMGWWGQVRNPNFEFSLLITAAYMVSFVFSIWLAREHEQSPSMHLAWMLFAGSCAFSVIRHSMFAYFALNLSMDISSEASYLETQIPMAIALVLLFVGLLSMWNGFSSLGLGFHPRRVDVALVTVMLLMLPPILFRDPEAVAKFVRGWIAVLPFAGAVLLPACAAIALLLRRTAVQMRGGDTAQFLQLFICYPAMRLVAMLISVDSHLNRIPALTVFGYAVFHTAPLVFTLALAYRWQITRKAGEAMSVEQAGWDKLYPIVT